MTVHSGSSDPGADIHKARADLTAEELQTAKAFGMTAEEYATYSIERQVSEEEQRHLEEITSYESPPPRPKPTSRLERDARSYESYTGVDTLPLEQAARRWQMIVRKRRREAIGHVRTAQVPAVAPSRRVRARGAGRPAGAHGRKTRSAAGRSDDSGESGEPEPGEPARRASDDDVGAAPKLGVLW